MHDNGFIADNRSDALDKHLFRDTSFGGLDVLEMMKEHQKINGTSNPDRDRGREEPQFLDFGAHDPFPGLDHQHLEDSSDTVPRSSTSPDTAVPTPLPADSTPPSSTTAVGDVASTANPASPATTTVGDGVGIANAVMPATAADGEGATASDPAVLANQAISGASSGPGSETGISPTPTATSQTGLLVGVESKPEVGNGTGYQNLTATQIAQEIAALGGQANEVEAPYDLTNPTSVSNLQQVYNADQAAGVQTIPELNLSWNDSESPASAYSNAYAQGQAFATNFGSETKMAIMGDEMDQHYTNFSTLVNQYEGLYNGIKSVDPSMQLEINATTAGVNSGFFTQLQNAGVQWDVTGVHPYLPSTSASDVQTNLVDVINEAAAYGKPVSVSEINGTPGPSNNPQQEALTLTTGLDTIGQMAQNGTPISDVMVYELANEPGGGSDQGFYGINNPAASAAVQQAFSSIEGAS